MSKTPTPTEQSKKQRDNIKTPPKTLITQLLRTDLGRSVGVTAVTKLVWLNRFTNIIGIGQRRLTHVPIGLCTKFGELHPELRIFLNFSWVIVIYHFVGCSNVYLKIIVKYEIDHHIRDPLTRDLDFPIFLLIDFKFWHVHFRLCRSVIF